MCDEIRLTLAEVRRRTPSAEPAWGPRGTTPRLTVRGTTAGAPPPPPPHCPGGSGQCNSCNALPHCLGAVGSGTPTMHCLTAWGHWAAASGRSVLLGLWGCRTGHTGLRGREVPSRGWSECPLGPVGRQNLAHGPGGTGSPAPGVVGASFKAHGEASSSENRAHRPWGDRESSPGGGRSLLLGPWGGVIFGEPGPPAWGGRGVKPRGWSEPPSRPMGRRLLRRTGPISVGLQGHRPRLRTLPDKERSPARLRAVPGRPGRGSSRTGHGRGHGHGTGRPMATCMSLKTVRGAWEAAIRMAENAECRAAHHEGITSPRKPASRLRPLPP